MLYNWFTYLRIKVANNYVENFLSVVGCAFVDVDTKRITFNYLFTNINWKIFFDLKSGSSLVHFQLR